MVDLEALLNSNAAKPAREQLTLIRIFEELRGRGYDGGYDAVRRYARRWAKDRADPVPKRAAQERFLMTRPLRAKAGAQEHGFPQRWRVQRRSTLLRLQM